MSSLKSDMMAKWSQSLCLKSHDVDDGVGATLALGAVGYGHRIVYHVLDAPTVLGQGHPLLLGVVLHIFK